MQHNFSGPVKVGDPYKSRLVLVAALGRYTLLTLLASCLVQEEQNGGWKKPNKCFIILFHIYIAVMIPKPA